MKVQKKLDEGKNVTPFEKSCHSRLSFLAQFSKKKTFNDVPQHSQIVNSSARSMMFKQEQLLSQQSESHENVEQLDFDSDQERREQSEQMKLQED